MNEPHQPATVWGLARLFLKLGSVAFGGPAAHIAMMEEEVVMRRRWLSRQHFVDLVGATNLIPGPNSTEMAIHIGYVKCGWRGLLISGCCFILPAALITLLLARIYAIYGQLPQGAPFLTGVQAAVIAVIGAAVLRLGPSVIKNARLAVLGAVVLAAVLLGANEVVMILSGGAIGMLWLNWREVSTRIGLPILFLSGGMVTAVGESPTLLKMGLFFLKIGSVLFGSGYVLIAFLEGGLVRDYQWLTQQQLLDTIAAGQLTPGPVLTTATFVGYLLLGWTGALVATVAIFLPSFFFVLLLNPVIPVLRKSVWTGAFLDAVNVTAVALIAAVSIELAFAQLRDWMSWGIFTAAAVLLLKYRVNAAVLILGASVLGWLLWRLGA